MSNWEKVCCQRPLHRKFDPKGPADIVRNNFPFPTNFLLAFLLLTLSFPTIGYGNETSIRLTHEGVLLLEEGKLEEAREKLKEALKADLKDEDARYYLAHAYVISGMYGSALKVLGEKSMHNWDAAFLRGLAHMNLNQSADAVTAFESSLKRQDNAKASFYLGMLHYQNANYADAKRHLSSNTKGLDADSEAYRKLYLGLISAQEEDHESARAYFNQVRDEHGDSPASALAVEMLDGGEQGAAAAAEKKYVYFDLRLIEQYDTNVGLVQANDTYAQVFHQDLTDDTSALRTALYLALRGVFGDETGFGGFVGISGFGAFNVGSDAAKDFNVLQGRGFGMLGYKQEDWGLEFPFSVGKTWIGTFDPTPSAYNLTAKLDAIYFKKLLEKLTLRTGVLFATNIFDGAAERDGYDLGVMLEAVSPLAESVVLRGGYTFNDYLTKLSGSPWGYLQNKVHLAATYRPIDRLVLLGQLAFANRMFNEDFIDPIDSSLRQRTDNELAYGLGGRLGLSKRTDLTLSYDGYKQLSIPSFTFDRHIVTLSFGVTF